MKLPLCMGYRVRYDPECRPICDSRGLWRWREIVVGPKWTQFPPEERAALLVHEVGHHRLRHLNARLRRVLTLRWRGLPAFCVAQELEADRFAAQHGHGAALANALARLTYPDTALHPPVAVRVERLRYRS